MGTGGATWGVSGLEVISSCLDPVRCADKIEHLAMRFMKSERDLGRSKASSVERGHSGNFRCPYEKHHDKYDDKDRVPLSNLLGLGTILSSILGGASALAMLSLDCRLQEQLDYTSQHWINEVSEIELLKFLRGHC
jgi:hypothetical protein